MSLIDVIQKKERLVIGLMSGTSADGIDAALVHIRGNGADTKVCLKAYISLPFETEVRARILKLMEGDFGGSRELCLLNGLLGQLYADACLELCASAGVSPESVDLVGCHGQTVFHQPEAVTYLGHPVAATYQLGDVSPICEALHTIAVSDFRVRDMAAGGYGAPLVPYTEYLIYKDKTRNIALQNIGGIGNVTYIPKTGSMKDVIAFDTGPGNVLIDRAIAKYSGGKMKYDAGGAVGGRYEVSRPLLEWLLSEPYMMVKPPKTTGRERYNEALFNSIVRQAQALGVDDGALVATVTAYTAETIAYSVNHYLPQKPERLIVGGGGSYNKTLMGHLRRLLSQTEVMDNEALGFNSDAKEAVAFALLANETISGRWNNVPSATGAAHPVVMGKISQ